MHYYFDKSLKTKEIKCEEIVTCITGLDPYPRN
jgi:hypothetical protein